MALTAERLRNNDRFTGENVTQFLLYLPFGLCLFVVRIILALILWVASIILPNKSTVRQMLSTLACLTFGVYVKVRGAREPRCSVLVANYVSCLDSLAAAHALGTVSLRKWKVPPFFASTLGIRNAAQFVRKEGAGGAGGAALLLQPEAGPGSGRALLRFVDWPCTAALVQPCTIEVERAFTRVTVHAGHSGGFPWRDALWFLLAPVTVFRLTLLPARAAGGEGGELARVLAARLGVPASDVEYAALCAPPTPRDPPARDPPAPVARDPPPPAPQELARRVKEVLPRVPLADIVRDLAATRSVDATVTNFLEGVTPYTPEPEPAPAQEPAPAHAHAHTHAHAHVPAPAPAAHAGAFPACARLRQHSFQERKALMVAEARRRYLEKHKLQLPGSG